MSKRFAKSEELLDRAVETIPLGSQTFSKSKTQYPRGVSPFFITRGAGSRVWDVDGNEYIDFVNALCAINLGYCDPDINEAVGAQLGAGTIFSLPHQLEMQVAETLRAMVPCAEMTRFGKNGSDATSGAVRLARAYTKRDHIAVCGYHGWQDWYIGSTARNLGVPLAVRELTHSFVYNSLESLDAVLNQHQGQIAAVIIEPMNVTEPLPGFLQGVQDRCREHQSLLVFDETITGFRFAKGGAQELFGVTPDLATFGKGMANGFPISALCGRAKYMELMEEIFFSFTFGGDTLALAAALATMNKIASKPVIESMRCQGGKIIDGVRTLILKHKMEQCLSITGNPTWSHLVFKDLGKYSMWQIKTLYYQEVFARGILTLGSHNMSYSHSDEDIHNLLGTYDEVFAELRSALDHEDLERRLRCEVLQPLFRLR